MKLNIKNDLTLCSKCKCSHLEQLRTIDKSRLQTYIGTLDEITMRGIDRALAVSMGIEHEAPQEEK